MGTRGILMATGLAPSDLAPFISILENAGLAGLGVMAFSLRWIVPKRTYEEKAEEAAQWKLLYEHEKEAHQATREALSFASQRGDAAVEAAKVTKVLLEAFRPARKRDEDAV